VVTRHWRRHVASAALTAAVVLPGLVGGGGAGAAEPSAHEPRAFCADMTKTARAGEALLVHPSLVAANRVTLAALVANNFLGQNAPAIASTEAQYSEMWAQDVNAMFGYHQSAVSGETKPELQMKATVVLEKVDAAVRRTCPDDVKTFAALTALERTKAGALT
jgi:hypothetical protein